MSELLEVYDTTLRDGSQGEGMAFSVADKLAVARLLDQLGVDYIEAGWPGATPKDTETFARAARELQLQHAVLTASGPTRRPGGRAADDPQVAALRAAGAAVVTLVAKAHARHVSAALRTTPQENLAMIADTVSHLRAEGLRVFLDAEHFFDGMTHPLGDAAYALEVLRTAAEAGAEVLVLCDTNGGMLPWQVEEVVGQVVREVGDPARARVAFHGHDDTGCGVANTLAAVRAGARQVQGSLNGYGERCGNADLVAVVANLEVKLGRPVLPAGRLAELTRVSHAVAEIANRAPANQAPYVGASAFAHKGGLHASAVKVDADLYQHVDPAAVGNDMRMLVSELAGRATVELKGRELGFDLAEGDVARRVVERVKVLESAGWSFEAAEASFELLLREELEGTRPRVFELESWRVITDAPAGLADPLAAAGTPDPRLASEATVKLRVQGERVVATGEGNGPVNALDTALRVALTPHFPQLAQLELTDYKVRILEGAHGTAAVTRVLVTTTDGDHEWTTAGVDENVIVASWHALEAAITYGLAPSPTRSRPLEEVAHR